MRVSIVQPGRCWEFPLCSSPGWFLTLFAFSSNLSPCLALSVSKTVTSLAIMAKYESEWPLFVICPASLRYTWPGEIERFFPSSLPASSIHVVAGFQDVDWSKRLATAGGGGGPIRVVVLTYSLFQNQSAVRHLFPTLDVKCVIVDESHNLRAMKSQRTQALLPVLRKARRCVLLSGTPALARPVELFPQLHCIAPQTFDSFNKFANRYCEPKKKRIPGGRGYVWEFKGSTNTAELNSKLQNIMVRRLKSDVLPELPTKQRSIVAVECSSAHRKRCKQMIKDLENVNVEKHLMDDDGTNSGSAAINVSMMKAYQMSGIGKAQAVADYLLDWLAGSSPSQKILVFAHHKDVLDALDQALLKRCPNSHIRIDGTVAPSVRHHMVQKFQTCSRIRVAVLSITAAGVGLTLTAASTVLFAELHWTPGVLAQAEDRAHRIGQQHDSVQIVYAICRDETSSIDMTLWKMLGKKIGTVDQVIDGKQVRALSRFLSQCKVHCERLLNIFFLLRSRFVL